MFWLLARELLRMRGNGSCNRKYEWKESVDLFFYRDADEIKRQQDAKQKKLQREKERAAGYAQQAQQEEDEMQAQDVDYGDDMQGYEEDDMQQVQQQQDGGYEQENWDMPATAIDDWGQEDNMEQQPVDEYEQEPQQQQQQQYVQQDQYGQGYEDPNDGGMGMQNW